MTTSALPETTDAVRTCLMRLQTCQPPLNDDWLRRVADLADQAIRRPEWLWSVLNSKEIWGGADSLANQALNPNTDYDAVLWQFHVRQFRDQMIELGELLQAHGRYYPDIDAWLLAFSNWNRSNA